MKFSEAVKLLEDGKKIRQKSWLRTSYVYLKDGYVCNNSGKLIDLETRSCSEEWEEYIEKVIVSSLKVGDKFRHGTDEVFLILPDEMKKYTYQTNIPVQNIKSDKVWIQHTSPDSMVVKVN